MGRDFGGRRRIALGGYRSGCGCQEQFLLELKRRLGYLPNVYQLGYNPGGVSASAGTHDLGMASDLRTLSWHEQTVAREIGTNAMNRTVSQGFSSYHNHSNVLGCPHGASLATWQAKVYLAYGSDGLGHGQYHDTGPQVRKVLQKDYFAALDRAAEVSKSQQAKQERAALIKRLRAHTLTIGGKKYAGISVVTVVGAVAARKSGSVSRYTYLIQWWLRKAPHGTPNLPTDGRWGPVTQSAFDRWRRANGWPDVVTGPPGLASLQKLAKQADAPYLIATKG